MVGAGAVAVGAGAWFRLVWVALPSSVVAPIAAREAVNAKKAAVLRRVRETGDLEVDKTEFANERA